MSQKIDIEKAIDTMAAMTGRMRKEDNTIINIADLLEKQAYVSGAVVGGGTAEFAAGATANTAKTITVVPDKVKNTLSLGIVNPSGESDLTVEVYDVINGKDYFSTWFTIPKKQTRANGLEVQAHVRLLPPVGCGDGVKIVLSNDSAVTTAFDVSLLIREV